MSLASLLTEEEERHELDEPNAWWTTLRHQGVLLSPIVLEEIFPSGPPTPSEGKYEQLRRRYRRFRNDPEDELYEWLDVVLEEFLEYPSKRWEKEHLVSSAFTTPDHRPNRVLLESEGEDEPDGRMLVWIDDDRVTTDEGDPGRIGIYSGKREHANLVKLMRETGVSLGLLTNGHQFRLVHATLDQESWTEWEASAWFEGGEGRVSLWGFRGLLSESVLPAPTEDEEKSLLGRIQESRDRQADLSDVMGTQVREAVELLLQELDDVLMQVDDETREEILAPLRELETSRRDELRARYQAAIRIVMRLVVALYAESRELFPKENPIYFESYSVEGLFRDLREARIEEGEDALEQQYGAWARFQAFSRLVYAGSPHKDVPMRGYGGRLFRPPEEDGDDEVLAALAAFEHNAVRISDAAMLQVLEKLKIAEFRSGGERRTGPVDFSDLRTEYIGMMYEGLLDYDLREATEEDGAIVFLNIGDEPALPFNVLESLDAGGMENLVDNLKSKSSGDFLADEEATEEDIDNEDDEATDTESDFTENFADDLEARVHQWAKGVVEETGVYMPHTNTVRAMDPTVRERVENEAAKKLVDRIIRPGGTYLVSWSGTRKSTGTFYTPPGLAVPTVHRTLEPLAYDEQEGGSLIPKKPEEILELKVCDPAMGSGTFPVAALNYLTNVLNESFEYHVFPVIDEGDPIAAPLGETAEGLLNERLLEIKKEGDEHWEDRLEIQLKRAIVERCIYGVDINPLAVELGKLSLWIETLDPDLPFTFLNHKLRVGNSLIGSWLNQFEHYPVAAWNREGGDGKKGDRTRRIRNFRNGELKEQMGIYIRENLNETHWFQPKSVQETDQLLQEARNTFNELHASVNETEKERLYYEEFQENDDIKTLRRLMDRWCAVWFWSMKTDDYPILDPNSFYNPEYDQEIDAIVKEISNRSKLKFFHWELEFPDAFSGNDWGFDAIVGNPPWETIESKTLEFFSQYRPEYRALNKQEAKSARKELFKNQPEIRDRWLDYKEYFKGFNNYSEYSDNPWDVALARGRKGKQLSKEWKEIRNRSGFNDFPVDTPYRFQGTGRPNTYKHFVEKFHFLCNSSGRIGFLSPAALYGDYGSQELRKLLLNNCSWEWIYSFENKNQIFDIHRSFNFSISIVDKAQLTNNIRCNFFVHDIEEWNTPKAPDHILVSLDQIRRFSPDILGLMEVRNQRDIDLIAKIYEGNTTLSEIEFSYRQGDYNLTNDSNLFERKKFLIDSGFKIDEYGVAYSDQGVEAVPLLEGRHVGSFDYQAAAHLEGKGRAAKWEHPDWGEKYLGPQYWIPVERIENPDQFITTRVGIMRVTAATNRRTIISTVLPLYPCGNTISILESDEATREDAIFLGAILNSYVLDFVARYKIHGRDTNWYLIKDLPIPSGNRKARERIIELSRRLMAPRPNVEHANGEFRVDIEDKSYVTDPVERNAIKEELDDEIRSLFGLNENDMKWILRKSNNDPRNLWKDYRERLKILGGDGKWGSLSEDETDESEEVTA